MEVVYPPNYPEPGDLYAALADAIFFYLEKRGQTMLNKAKSQLMRYLLVLRVFFSMPVDRFISLF